MRKYRFEVGIDFILLIAVLYCIDTQNILILAIFSAIIHEIGHILAIWMCSAYIDRIQIGAFGANIVLASYPMLSYRRELFIALAGPLFGFLAAIVFALIGGEIFYLLAGLNLILSLFNLLPAYPLDGGRILRNIGQLFMREDHAAKLSAAGNILSAIFVLGLCLVINLKFSFSLSFTMFSIFIAISMLRSIKSVMAY